MPGKKMDMLSEKTEESGDVVPEVRTMITRRPTLTRRMTIEEEHMGEYFVRIASSPMMQED
ncbi:hypothetical protein ANCCEY_07375 [Ancylostoma ceylanicum]|uniref:Uncharacterized protein n=1 Tax=Ancylostoma ceylanicum TaxID=53326 RepID=A0A0D6LN50_9BILA|nr:hypothetical protein ANCCEY_07375 [Ancylostoma ceylanicum]